MWASRMGQGLKFAVMGWRVLTEVMASGLEEARWEKQSPRQEFFDSLQSTPDGRARLLWIC